jgi:CIC family chloride channel protein
VVAADGRYRGCVFAQDVAEALELDEPPGTINDLTGLTTTIGADAGPQEILAALSGHGGTGLPVLDRDRTALIGWITYETVLARMHPGISEQ